MIISRNNLNRHNFGGSGDGNSRSERTQRLLAGDARSAAPGGAAHRAVIPPLAFRLGSPGPARVVLGVDRVFSGIWCQGWKSRAVIPCAPDQRTAPQRLPHTPLPSAMLPLCCRGRSLPGKDRRRVSARGVATGPRCRRIAGRNDGKRRIGGLRDRARRSNAAARDEPSGAIIRMGPSRLGRFAEIYGIALSGGGDELVASSRSRQPALSDCSWM